MSVHTVAQVIGAFVIPLSCAAVAGCRIKEGYIMFIIVILLGFVGIIHKR